MANQLYGKYVEAALEGTFDTVTVNLKVALVTSGYTPSINVDQFVTDIGGGNIVARSGNLGSVTGSLGTLSAATETLTSVSGSAVSYIILYRDTGSDATSNLIAKWDTATGLPLTPNGGNITITWNASGLFQL